MRCELLTGCGMECKDGRKIDDLMSFVRQFGTSSAFVVMSRHDKRSD